MFVHWSLSNSDSPYISRTLLSILSDLNSAVVWVVFTLVLISNSSSPFTNLLSTVLSEPIIIGITVTFIIHSFFSSLSRSWCLGLFSTASLFLLTIARSGRLAKVKGSIRISKSQRIFCIFSMTDSGLYIYHLFVWSNLHFLHSFHWITFPTQSCLVLCYVCANLLHLLIMWLSISFLSAHNLHSLFCCVLFIFAFT